MIACLFWDLVWGFPGLFLAMPIMAGIRAVCLYTPGLRAWAYLMSTERGMKAWQLEERVAAMAARTPEANGDTEATMVMEELKEKSSAG
jgi:AI-2 transport protein TqsA